MMNKLCCFGILLGFTFQLAWAQVELRVGDVNATAGSQVIVPVLISEGRDITAIQFTVGFQTQVLSIAESGVLTGDALRDHSIGSSQEDGTLIVVIFSGSLESLRPGAGSVIRLLFDVADGAVGGSTTMVTLSDVQVSNDDGNAVPVTARGGSVTISEEANLPGEGENELLFAQVANGAFPGGSFGVILIFVNRTGAPSTGEIRFFKSDATPFVLALTDGQMDSVFTFTVAPGGSVFLQTDGSGDLSAGYARLSATAPLGGTVLFASRDAGGNILTEAGVGASPLTDHFSVPVLFEAGTANTGIALVNVLKEGVEVTLVLKDEDGAEVARTVLNLGAGEHLPQFANEFFDVLNERADFRGSIDVWASAAVAAIALKQQGALLTTFPIIVRQ